MFLHTPPRREDDKVSNGHTRLSAGASQHCEDGGILREREGERGRERESS